MTCSKLVKEPHNPFPRQCKRKAWKGGRCRIHQPEAVAKRKHEQERRVWFKAHGADIGPYTPKGQQG